MKLPVRILLFVLAVTVFTIAFAFLIVVLIDAMPDSESFGWVGSLAGIAYVAALGGLIWFFFGRRRRLQKRRAQQLEQQASRLRIPQGNPAQEPMFLQAWALYNEETLKEAYTFLTVYANNRHGRAWWLYTLVLCVLLAAAALFLGRWQLLLVPAIMVLLVALMLFTARRNAKNPWNAGEVHFRFFDSHMRVRLRSAAGETDNMVSYSFLTTISETPTAFYFRNQSNSTYFLPKTYISWEDQERLASFLRERFPTSYALVGGKHR